MAASKTVFPHLKIPTGVAISFTNVNELSQEFVELLYQNGFIGNQYLTNGCFFWSLLLCLIQSMISTVRFMTDAEKHLIVLHLMEKSGFRRFNELLDTERDAHAIQTMCDFFEIQIKFYSYNPIYTEIESVGEDEIIHLHPDTPYTQFGEQYNNCILIWTMGNHYSALQEIIPNNNLNNAGSNFIVNLYNKLQYLDLHDIPIELEKDYCDPKTTALIEELSKTPEVVGSVNDDENASLILALQLEMEEEQQQVNEPNDNNDNEEASLRLVRELSQPEVPFFSGAPRRNNRNRNNRRHTPFEEFIPPGFETPIPIPSESSLLDFPDVVDDEYEASITLANQLNDEYNLPPPPTDLPVQQLYQQANHLAMNLSNQMHLFFN